MTTSTTEKESLLTKFRERLRRLGRSVGDGWRSAGVNFRNWRRKRRGARLDYIVMPLSGSFPERDGPPRSFLERRLPFPAAAFSLERLNKRVQLITDADNVRGVVFLLRNLSAGLGTLQNLRQSIERLRAVGKEVIVYTPYLDMRHYYLASAANRIVAPPGARFDAIGLYTEVTFLKDALSRAGVAVDVIQISPYKSAFDRFGQSDLTPEYREQLSWLLDEQYDILTAAMAAGRGLTQAQMQALIDRSPLTLEEAKASGLIDDIAYDDELPVLLAPVDEGAGEAQTAESSVTPNGDEQKTDTATATQEPRRARLKTWSEGYRLLNEQYRPRSRRFLGVISLEGTIAMGPSRTPPIDLPIPFLGGSMAGEQTLVSLLRKAEKQKDMAALILHVDSGGGSALASDLIGRQVALLAKKKPVLVYMGNMAASGGYYVAAPAQHIMSQTATITGSIGVIMAHVSTAGLLDMASVNRVALQRGENAGLYADANPLSDNARAVYWREIVHTYEQFKQTVSEGRRLPVGELDPLCEGRVWTGRQARERGLVDSHGDFLDAVRQAAEMAKLPTEDVHAIPVANLFAKDSSYVLPPNGPKAAMAQLTEMFSAERLMEWNGRPLLIMPFTLRLR